MDKSLSEISAETDKMAAEYDLLPRIKREREYSLPFAAILIIFSPILAWIGFTIWSGNHAAPELLTPIERARMAKPGIMVTDGSVPSSCPAESLFTIDKDGSLHCGPTTEQLLTLKSGECWNYIEAGVQATICNSGVNQVHYKLEVAH